MHTPGFLKSITRQIRRSQKPTTILFTDIEDSTAYWERHGDVKGRLMVDMHNRLVFPVIRRYRGTIVKTIGDAVMASFKNPERALRAAIGIQQALERRREQDRSFKLRVRIGIHAGKAIVEDKDVFGDAVNVAARVESRGKGDDILISASAAARLKRSDYHLIKKGSFVPKGKTDSITVYRCQWRDCSSMIDSVSFTSVLPVVKRQKIELLAYAVVTLSLLYLLYLRYLRYVVSDSEAWALVALNPLQTLRDQPALIAGLLVLFSGITVLVVRVRSIPHLVLRGLKGGFGFSVVFMALLVVGKIVPGLDTARSNRVLHESQHLFVEVLEDEADIREAPDEHAAAVLSVPRGKLLLLTDITEGKGTTWNKVLIGRQAYGWVPRVLPERIGEPERRVTLAYKFRFRLFDVVLFAAGLFGFAWGALNFRLKPT